MLFKLEYGDVVERHLQNGDVVILNRQPTLHRGSMLSMKVNIKPGYTIRTNLAITSSFNLDYDGDEVNIHVPQTMMAKVDIDSLASVSNNITNVQDGKPIPVIIQDALLGLYLLTKDNVIISKENVFQLIMSITRDDTQDISEYLEKIEKFKGKKIRKIKQMTGKTVFSILLPKYFYFKFNDLLISNGRLETGTISKGNISKLITSLFSNYNRDIAIDFINNCQFMANAYLLMTGFSVGYKDCLLNQNKVQDIHDKINLYFDEAETYQQKLQKYPLIQEARISSSLHKAKDTSQKIARDNMPDKNSFKEMITSGSKGNFSNISQISGALGQQNVSGKRILPTISENTRTLSCFPLSFTTQNSSKRDIELKYKSKGFIMSSFFKGLDPVELFFHAACSREGVTDTACKTAESGYLQRKAVKMLEDIHVAYDGTVRNSRQTIVEFNYGEDSLSGACVNTKQDFCNLVEISERLNSEYESTL